jgi:hypothetical protein
MGDRIKTSATLVTVLGKIILIAPLIVLADSLVKNFLRAGCWLC